RAADTSRVPLERVLVEAALLAHVGVPHSKLPLVGRPRLSVTAMDHAVGRGDTRLHRGRYPEQRPADRDRQQQPTSSAKASKSAHTTLLSQRCRFAGSLLPGAAGVNAETRPKERLAGGLGASTVPVPALGHEPRARSPYPPGPSRECARLRR